MVSTPSQSDFTDRPVIGPDAEPAPLGHPGDDADAFDRAIGIVAASVAELSATEPRTAVSLGAGVVDTLASLLEREAR